MTDQAQEDILGCAKTFALNVDGQIETMEFNQSYSDSKRDTEQGRNEYLRFAAEYVRGKALAWNVLQITTLIKDRATGQFVVASVWNQ